MSENDKQRRPRPRSAGGTACPACGSRSLRKGPWPWYLGTVGLMVCRPLACNDCDHQFDGNKPNADLARRKTILALVINGVGLLGILGVIAAFLLYVVWMSSR